MDTVSPKFRYRTWAQPYGGKLPRLLSVKGFEGVLIHVGNSDENSVAEPAPTEQPAADTAESADTPEKEAAQAVRSDQDPAPEETGPDGE